MSLMKIYLATVGLDPNRWGSREPAFAVSEWMPRLYIDGFDGVELWEYHFARADESEQARLIEHRDMIPLYNTYAGFSSSDEHQRQRQDAADAIGKLETVGVKFNLQREPDRVDEYRENLLAWAQQLPASCRLLCECHPGTVLEHVEDAAAFFKSLDRERFGIIAHLTTEADRLEPWLHAFGDQLCHLHLQRRDDQDDPATRTGQTSMQAMAEILKNNNFTGTATIEFSRGIGKAEQIETVYGHMLADARALKESCHPI